MRSLPIALLCFLCVAGIYGQTTAKNYFGRIDVEITKTKGPQKISIKVNIKSPFPGGDSAWVQSLEKNITQSIAAGKRLKKGKYIVSVKFVLSKDGSLSDIACENDPGFGLCGEVIRVLKKAKKWTPAEPAAVQVFSNAERYG